MKFKSFLIEEDNFLRTPTSADIEKYEGSEDAIKIGENPDLGTVVFVYVSDKDVWSTAYGYSKDYPWVGGEKSQNEDYESKAEAIRHAGNLLRNKAIPDTPHRAFRKANDYDKWVVIDKNSIPHAQVKSIPTEKAGWLQGEESDFCLTYSKGIWSLTEYEASGAIGYTDTAREVNDIEKKANKVFFSFKNIPLRVEIELEKTALKEDTNETLDVTPLIKRLKDAPPGSIPSPLRDLDGWKVLITENYDAALQEYVKSPISGWLKKAGSSFCLSLVEGVWSLIEFKKDFSVTFSVTSEDLHIVEQKAKKKYKDFASIPLQLEDALIKANIYEGVRKSGKALTEAAKTIRVFTSQKMWMVDSLDIPVTDIKQVLQTKKVKELDGSTSEVTRVELNSGKKYWANPKTLKKLKLVEGLKPQTKSYPDSVQGVLDYLQADSLYDLSDVKVKPYQGVAGVWTAEWESGAKVMVYLPGNYKSVHHSDATRKHGDFEEFGKVEAPTRRGTRKRTISESDKNSLKVGDEVVFNSPDQMGSGKIISDDGIYDTDENGKPLGDLEIETVEGEKITVDAKFVKRSSNHETETGSRTLRAIARDIRADWKNISSSYAFPYYQAMADINTIHDTYGADSAYSVVLYFLSNAAGWKGEKAKEIKAELKKLCKEYEKNNKLKENIDFSINEAKAVKKDKVYNMQIAYEHHVLNPKAIKAMCKANKITVVDNDEQETAVYSCANKEGLKELYLNFFETSHKMSGDRKPEIYEE